jgi:phage terminase large subunit-like protein
MPCSVDDETSDRSAWMKDPRAELLAFPMGRHDDFVDTLAYAVLAIASSRSAYADRGVMMTV